MKQATWHIQKQVDRALGKLVEKGVVKERAPNATYDCVAVLQVLFCAAMLRTFVESAVSRMRNVWNRIVPDADTVFRRLKENGKASLMALISFNREMVGAAKRKGWFRKRVVVAIDMWDREYYGKQRDVNCSTGKEKNGTRYFHRVATLAVVEEGKRLEVAMMSVSLFAPKQRIVHALLVEALRFIRIKVVLLDRGFNSHAVIRTIEALNLRYIMPMTKNRRVKREIAQTSGLWYRVVENYRFRLNSHLETTLIILDVKLLDKKAARDSYLTYITNFHVYNAKESVMAVAHFYESRWGIETGYRVKKWEFRAKTCSESTMVRFFFILLAIILFNIWTLMRFANPIRHKNGVPAYILTEAYLQMIRASSA